MQYSAYELFCFQLLVSTIFCNRSTASHRQGCKVYQIALPSKVKARALWVIRMRHARALICFALLVSRICSLPSRAVLAQPPMEKASP